MLKMGANGRRGGKRVQFMIVGLSHLNLDRLREGKPIICSGADFGLSGEIELVIFSGSTEQSMAREMHELVGPNTNVSIDPRLRD